MVTTAGSRHRAFHLRHRPQQGRHRGSFRPAIRARNDAAGAPEAHRARIPQQGAAGARLNQFHPAAGAARLGTRGLVRAGARRPRAVRAAAAGRAGPAPARLPGADDGRGTRG